MNIQPETIVNQTITLLILKLLDSMKNVNLDLNTIKEHWKGNGHPYVFYPRGFHHINGLWDNNQIVEENDSSFYIIGENDKNLRIKIKSINESLMVISWELPTSSEQITLNKISYIRVLQLLAVLRTHSLSKPQKK